MRICTLTSPILAKTPWLLVALAVLLLGLTTVLGIGAAQRPAAPAEPLAAPKPMLVPPPILPPPEPPRPAPRGAEIALRVEAIVAPEASAQAAPGVANEPSVRCYRLRRLFRRGR